MTYESQPAPSNPVPPQTSGLAVAALVVGVVSILFAVFLFPLGLIGGVIGLVLGFVARGKIKRGEGAGAGLALGGIITSLLAVLIAIVWGVLLVNVFQEVVDCLDPDLTEEEATQCVNDRLTDGS